MVVPSCHGFARAASGSHALAVVCVFFPSVCTTCEIICLSLSEILLYGLRIWALWSERSCMTSCSSSSPLQTAQANHYMFCRFFNVPVFSADNSCRSAPHMQKNVAFALCSW